MSDNKERYTIVEFPLEMFVLSDYLDPEIKEQVFLSFSVSVAGQQVNGSGVHLWAVSSARVRRALSYL